MRLSEFLPIEVDMKYRICVPLRFEGVDGETAEELLASEKIVLEGGDEQALAKTTGAAEEIDFPHRDKVIH